MPSKKETQEDKLTSIRIHASTLTRLSNAKVYRRESYEDLIIRLLDKVKP